jgi:hypothetical protein
MPGQDGPYHHPGRTTRLDGSRPHNARRARRWIATLTCCALSATTLMAWTPAPANAKVRANAGARRPSAAAATAVFAGSKRMSRSVRMQERFAEWSLRSNGIGWRSNGHCSDRNRTDCTSFEGMRWGSIDGLIDFKQDSGCHLTVSGGTERGHAKGRYSHANGYKIDIMPTRCTDRHITRDYRHVGVRGDGAELYRSRENVVFAREDSHWDLLFR